MKKLCIVFISLFIFLSHLSAAFQAKTITNDYKPLSIMKPTTPTALKAAPITTKIKKKKAVKVSVPKITVTKKKKAVKVIKITAKKSAKKKK